MYELFLSYDPDGSRLTHFVHLLTRPWFQRIWIIQEVAIFISVETVCGDEALQFDLFLDAFSLFVNLGFVLLLPFDLRQAFAPAMEKIIAIISFP